MRDGTEVRGSEGLRDRGGTAASAVSTEDNKHPERKKRLRTLSVRARRVLVILCRATQDGTLQDQGRAPRKGVIVEADHSDDRLQSHHTTLNKHNHFFFVVVGTQKWVHSSKPSEEKRN